MASFPDFPKALLAISSLFASPGWQAAERARFVKMDMRLEKFNEHSTQLFENIFDTLSLTPELELRDDFGRQALAFGAILDALALHTTTFGADERLILWRLGRFFAPGLGRTWGFWSRDEPIMPDLPGQDLWFLPHVDPDHPDRLVLPVEVIARWWRSLLKGPIESIWLDEGDDRHRTFQTWLAGQATPTPQKLTEWFSDDRVFVYRADVSAPPKTQAVRKLLLWARALETSWKTLVAALTPDVAPDEPDPMRNKALQLVELFRLAHQMTIAPMTKNSQAADRMFLAMVPDWLKHGDFRSILPTANGQLPTAEECAGWLSADFMAMVPGAPLQNIFRDAAMIAPADPVTALAILAERQQLAGFLEMGFAAWRLGQADRAARVKEVLTLARSNPRSADMEAKIHYLAALDALSEGDFDAARAFLDRGLEACSQGGFGPVRLEIARLRFALFVAEDAFNQNRSEAVFRIFSRSLQPDEAERWLIGRAPLEHSIRMAAVEFHSELWSGAIRPYAGVHIEHPLEENAEIFKSYIGLLLSNADEAQLRVFLADYRGILKRKLRDIRGDTFFTMTTKMVSDLVARMRQMPSPSQMRGNPSLPSPQTLAAYIRETHLRFVRLLPTDMLNARDYLGQTALMLAADQKDAELLQILIQRHVDLDAQDTLGRTALHSAVRANAGDCFKSLIDAGADPSLTTCEGKTPAVFAAEFGRATIFKFRLAQSTRPFTEVELKEALNLATRNKSGYRRVRAEYRGQGVTLGDRSAFKEILAALDRQI